MPVKAPCEADVEPIFIPALKTKLVFNGELFPSRLRKNDGAT
jgi:hypothetical protein